MIPTTVSVAVMALLFVLFGALGIADGKRACDGSCSGCHGACESDVDPPWR